MIEKKMSYAQYMKQRKADVASALQCKCTACRREFPQSSKRIGYTQDYVPYCMSQFDCESSAHINSVPSVTARGTLIVLHSYDEALESLLEQHISPRERQIMKYAREAISIRIPDVATIAYLLELGEDNIRDGIRKVLAEATKASGFVVNVDANAPRPIVKVGETIIAPIVAEIRETVNHEKAVEHAHAEQENDFEIWEV